MSSVPRPVAPRREQSGVILILALFVILILLVIVPQFRISARVERELAFNDVEDLQMESLARAGVMRAKAALLVDLTDDQSEGEDLGDGSGGGATKGGGSSIGGTGGGGADGASGDSGGAQGGGATGQHVDSLDEVWANGEFTLEIGEEAGFKTKIVISDEDAKLNLLLLFAEDENYRKEWRERVERALDLMRDGQEDDLSLSDASDLVDRVEKWMQGDRHDEELSTAPLASGDWRGLLGKPVLAPLSLSELCLAGGVRPALLHGVGLGEDEQYKWLPGLEQTLTVWSNLELAEEQKEQDSSIKPPDLSIDKRARPEAQGVNNGRINVNTAPIWVLKSLFPDNEVPYSAWDKFAEFRRKELEDLKQERTDLENASDDEKQRRKQEDQKEPEAAKYPLETIDDLRKCEGFSPDSSAMSPERWNKLSSFLSVESNVFTITVMVGSNDARHRFYVARSVVWRKDEGDQSTCIPIVPFERVPTSAVDMHDFVKEMEEWQDTYSK
jgi:hypothetical protein